MPIRVVRGTRRAGEQPQRHNGGRQGTESSSHTDPLQTGDGWLRRVTRVKRDSEGSVAPMMTVRCGVPSPTQGSYDA